LRKVNEKGWVVGRKEWAEVEFVPTKPSRDIVKNLMKTWMRYESRGTWDEPEERREVVQ
jgi:hypothetical protein